MPDFKDGCPCQSVDYDNFRLMSPLGGLFRYYTDSGSYYRETLNQRARWTQEDRTKRISKTVYDLAHRTAVKADDKDDRQTEAKQIEADYKAGSISFVEAVYDLRQAGYPPIYAQNMVDKWIREKYNNGPRDK